MANAKRVSTTCFKINNITINGDTEEKIGDRRPTTDGELKKKKIVMMNAKE